MSANGSNQKKVPNADFYNNYAGGGNPAFSPSGRKIIYDAGGDIHTINVDGTNRTRITNSQGGDPYGDHPLFSNPVWSPVSNKIAFNYFFGEAYTYVKSLSYLLHRQYLDDSGGVTPGSRSYRPDWSPNGSQVVFECIDDPCYYDPNGRSVNPEIYKANANGTDDPIRLTNDPAKDTYPAFSPGGGKVVFSSNRDGDYDLYITNADGTGDPQPLTTNSARDVLPDWQPVQ